MNLRSFLSRKYRIVKTQEYPCSTKFYVEEHVFWFHWRRLTYACGEAGLLTFVCSSHEDAFKFLKEHISKQVDLVRFKPSSEVTGEWQTLEILKELKRNMENVPKCMTY